MTVLNMQAASEALKLFYLDGLTYQLNIANPILAMIERDSKSVVGSEIVMALRYGRNGGVGNRADDGNLPTPNSRKTKQAKWDTKNIFARIQITDKTMKASRSSRGAFVSLLEADLEDAQADAKDSQARQVFGDGTGKLATFAVNADTVTLEVDNIQYFTEGMLIDIVDDGGIVTVSEREILIVDDVANTIKISGANVTTAATDIAVPAGSYNLEMTGFGKVFTADNTLYNINRAENKWFNPLLKALGGEISESAIQTQIDDADRKAGGKTNFLMGSYGVRRAYMDLQLASKRTVNSMELKGGFEAIKYNNIPFAVDKYNPAGVLYGLDLETWKLYHMGDWDWMADDGAVLRQVSGKPVWEASLVRYCDIGCNKPRGNWKMSGIVEH